MTAEFWRTHGMALQQIAGSLATIPEPVDDHVIAAIQRALDLASDPLRAAVIARTLDAISRLSVNLDPKVSAHILTNESGRDILLDLVEQAPLQAPTPPDEAIQQARVRGLRTRTTILDAEGGVWSAEEVGAHLGISRQAVERRRQRGRLLGLPIGGRAYVYPRWQFDADSMLPGFLEVCSNFTIPGAWTRAAFFLGTNSLLDGARPIDELRKGHIAAVERAAASFGEQLAV